MSVTSLDDAASAARLAASSAPCSVSGRSATRAAAASIAMLLMMAATVSAADLSKYRRFQLGSALATVAKQVGTSPSLAKEISRRPALIQQLEWRPGFLGSPSKNESVQQLLFTFYDGELFRIVVNYDQSRTEGLTNQDVVETLTRQYGVAEMSPTVAKGIDDPYDRQDLLARWEDADYRFDLGRLAYGNGFRLTGVLKRLETLSRTAAVEAKRLDDEDNSRKETARVAGDERAAKAATEKSRLVNKPNFRP